MGEAIDASILREAAGRNYTETWLVLEFCDKGNLQEAVDHGDFLIRSIINGQQHTQQNMVAIMYLSFFPFPPALICYCQHFLVDDANSVRCGYKDGILHLQRDL